jgi:ribulose kinase
MHLLTQKQKIMTATQIINDLHDFVTTQAAEDAGLSPSEKSYQTELVADVLGQEAPSHKAFETLLDLYHTERQAA